MDEVFLLSLVGLTSIGAYLVGTRRLGLQARGFGAAVGKMFEAVGVVVVFALANVAVGAAVVLATRGLLHRFLSLYMVDDVTLWALSLLQGLAFQWWRASAAPRP